ncbi:translation initiation factor IF-2-like, partial [Corvus kubaryi]|uniref:translation initiation factor IF-2-like n=1 Tax=Corvus kubaryi TaxID=68294 RepID=UPI001C03F707
PRLQQPSRGRCGWVRRAAATTVPAATGPSGPPQGGGAAGPDPEPPKPNFGRRKGRLRRRGSARRPRQPGRGSGERGSITPCTGAERGRGRGGAPLREEAARPPAQAGWHRCKARPSASSSPAGTSVPRAVAAAGRTPGGGAGLPPAPPARPPAAGASRRPAHLREQAAAAGGARTAPGAGSTPPAPSPGSSAAAAGPRSSAGSPRTRRAGPRPAPAAGRDGRGPRLPPGRDGAACGDRPSAGERRQLPGAKGGGLLPSARPRAVMLAWRRSRLCRREARSNKRKHTKKPRPIPPPRHQKTSQPWRGLAAVGGEGPQRSAVAAGREGGIASHLGRSCDWTRVDRAFVSQIQTWEGGAECQGTVST